MPERDMEGKLFPLHDRPLSFLNRALRAQFKNAMKRFPLREIEFPCVGIVPPSAHMSPSTILSAKAGHDPRGGLGNLLFFRSLPPKA